MVLATLFEWLKLTRIDHRIFARCIVVNKLYIFQHIIRVFFKYFCIDSMLVGIVSFPPKVPSGKIGLKMGTFAQCTCARCTMLIK